MINHQQLLKPALRRGDLAAEYNRTAPAYSAANVNRINLGLIKQVPACAASGSPGVAQQPVRQQIPQPVYAQPHPARSIPRPAPAPTPALVPVAPSPTQLPMPRLEREVQRGQKMPLNLLDPHAKLRVCFGWQLNRGDCDPQFRTDTNWKTFIGRASGESYAFEWGGNQPVTVIVQPSERRGGIQLPVD